LRGLHLGEGCSEYRPSDFEPASRSLAGFWFLTTRWGIVTLRAAISRCCQTFDTGLQ